MSDIIKFYKRAEIGKRIKEKEFDIEILPRKLGKLIKKYNIKYNPKEALPQDLKMAGRIYDAAIELLLEIGIHCKNTNSIIEIEEDDIKQAFNEAPSIAEIGAGSEKVTPFSREISDKRRPGIIGGANGAPISEENFIRIMTSYAKEPIDALHTGPLQSLFGQNILANTPIEILACKYEALWAKESLRRAGKAGISVLGIMTGITSEGQNAADFEGGLTPADMHLIVFLNELKADFDSFKKIVHNQFLGNTIIAATCPQIGGYCGGAEGTAITSVAEIIQGYVMAKPKAAGLYPLNLYSGVSSDKMTTWVSCVVPMAFKSAGIDLILATYIGGAAGPCTDMLCDEIAAQTIAQTASGISAFCGPVGSSMNQVDYLTGMETRMLSEISRAASGISLSKANEIVKRLNAKYENAVMSKKVPVGNNFQECYDINKLEPSKKYLTLWEKKKKKLAKMGLNFK